MSVLYTSLEEDLQIFTQVKGNCLTVMPKSSSQKLFPATFGCILSPAHLNQMSGFPDQYVNDLCRGLDSDML